MATYKATQLRGRQLMVFISNGQTTLPVALSTNCTITMNAETTDSKTKDDGIFSASNISGITWEITNESLHTVESRTIDWTYDALFEKMTEAQPVDVVFGVPTNANTTGVPEAGWTSPGTYTGKALITSLELNGPVDGDATVSLSLSGYGPLTKA